MMTTSCIIRPFTNHERLGSYRKAQSLGRSAACEEKHGPASPRSCWAHLVQNGGDETLGHDRTGLNLRTNGLKSDFPVAGIYLGFEPVSRLGLWARQNRAAIQAVR